MKIILNPSNTTCPDYNFNGERVNIDGLKPKEMKQYEDEVALDMLARWAFLQEVAPAAVESTLKEIKEPKFACKQCDFKADYQVALAGHMRSHDKEETSKPQIDPNVVPVASSKKVFNAEKVKEIQQKLESNQVLNGTDKDGVTWYGEGVKEDNQSLKKVRPYGKGHFKG